MYRSVSLSLAADQSAFRGAKSYSFNGTASVAAGENLAEVPKQTMLNEVVFERYHLFHSDARILTGQSLEPASNPVTEMNSPARIAELSASSALPALASENTARNASATAAVATATEPAPATADTAAPATAAKAPVAPGRPEISVAAQKTPMIPTTPPTEASFSLRVTTRLVDIGLTAFDKKGKPVTDLTREDFQVSDNGRKQSLRSFGHAAGATAAAPSSATAAQPAQYTNRIDADGNGQSAGGANAESTTIIYFDATSLKFDDLNRARQQAIKVLGTLPFSEPVGLYVRTDAGFRVMVEGTTDRSSVTAALGRWRPDARDVARAQEQEMRNRQQFDTLRTPAGVGFAYATVGGAGGGAGLSLDPKLMNLGDDPSREALTVLVAVATHMGAIPGHKNLVWISSDNVLADWTDQSADGDAGRMSPNSIGAFSIRTQEALNNAHVSLYPFDASQLETDATDASLQNAGVQLDASTKDQYPLFKTPPGGRSASQLRQQTHPVQVAMQELAESTGGESFSRSGNVLVNLNRVVEDGHAAYLLSFAPDTPPDDQYHRLTVSVPSRPGIELRYRTGYLYSKEPATLKERFAQVLWQPFEATEIGLSAQWGFASSGAAVSLNIATADISLAQQGNRRTGKLDIFLVQREDLGVRSLVSEQTLVLDLKPATYEKVLRDGIPFDQYFDNKRNSGIVRIIVVDEDSGRIGSITLPAATGSTKQ